MDGFSYIVNLAVVVASFGTMIYFVGWGDGIALIPHGTVIFIAIGMYICGLAAGRIKGDSTSIFTTLFASTSWFLITRSISTTYSLLFLVSALYTYIYVLRFQGYNRPIRYSVLLGVMAAIFGYLHDFGLLVVVILFLFDVLRIFAQRIDIRQMLAYPIAAILYLPYFFLLRDSPPLLLWAQTPRTLPHTVNVQTVFELVQNMVGSSDLVLAAIILGVTISLYEAVLSSYRTVYLCAVQALVLAIAMIVAIVYGSVVDSSVFVEQYFVVLLPQVFLVAAMGLGWVFDSLFKYKSFVVVCAVVVVLLIPLGINTILQLQEYAYIMTQ